MSIKHYFHLFHPSYLNIEVSLDIFSSMWMVLIYYHIFWWFWLPFLKHKPLMYMHYIYIYIYISRKHFIEISFINTSWIIMVMVMCDWYVPKKLSSRNTSSKCNNRNDYNHNVKKMYIPSLRVTCRWKSMVMEIGDDATHRLRWIS